MKIMPGDINILYMYTINDNHVMYGSRDMEHSGQNFLSFWTAFCPFTPLKTQKIKIFKKWKKPWRYHHLTQVHQKSWLHATLFLRYNAWLMSFLFFILGYLLLFYNSKNQNQKKKKKMSGDIIIILYMCTKPKIMIMFLEYGVQQTNGST